MASFDTGVGDVRLLGGLAVLVVSAISAIRARRLLSTSKSWPTVAGTILYGRARGVSDGSGSVIWYAEMAYSFTTINGDYYAGTFDQRMASEEQADEYARKMKDAKISVRYKPGDPDTSFALLT